MGKTYDRERASGVMGPNDVLPLDLGVLLESLTKLKEKVENDQTVSSPFRDSFLRDPIFGIPDRLMDAIGNVPIPLKSKGVRPTKAEQAYEKELASLCDEKICVGFKNNSPIIHWHAVPGWGRPFDFIESTDAVKKDRVNFVLDTLTSYLGWLITDRIYGIELAKLRADWPDGTPLPLLSEIVNYARSDRYDFDRLAKFCHRWCLTHFETWDLPVPAGLRYNACFLKQKITFGCVGTQIFVPQTIRFNGNLNIAEWLNDAFDASPEHLKGWTDVLSKNQKLASRRPLGQQSFYDVFTLAHLSRILNDRYPGLGKGHIDSALGSYLAKSASSVIKLRKTLKAHGRVKAF